MEELENKVPGQEKEELKGKKLTAALSYLFWFVVIPIIYSSESKFIRYHANQGLVLAIAETIFILVTVFITKILWAFSMSTSLLVQVMLFAIFVGVFGIIVLIGLLNVYLGRTKPIPTFGKIQLLK